MSLETTEQTKLTSLRILGSYPQKQTGLFMQRIKLLGGRLNWLQWRKVAELAQKYSPETGLHLTTRQDIEFHNIPEEDLPAVHQGLNSVGLRIFGACGDTIRNLTVTTGCQSCEDTLDLIPLAELVRTHLEQLAISCALPRKFKISFASCSHVPAKAWINDIAFITSNDGTFTVIGAGSLGPRPATGIKLYENLPVKDVLPLCIAAVELFNDKGDRENRHKARLRHVREKLGDEVFIQQLNDYFIRIRDSRQWPDLILNAEDKNIKLIHRLQLPNGNISVEGALKLADIFEKQNGQLRINIEHALEIYGTKAVTLPDDIVELAENPVIVACPGASTCPRAISDGWKLSDKLREILKGVPHNGTRINISGCPNNCGQSSAAEIGLIGMLRKIDGQSVEHYQVLVGGGNGNDEKLATSQGVFPAAEVPALVKKIIEDSKVLTVPQ